MLTILKKAAGTWVAKVLLGLLVLSFAVWGITGASFNFASGSLASVGSQRISTLDFQRELLRETQIVGQQIGRGLTPQQAVQFGLDREVLARMINQATLDDRTETFGIGVSEDKIAEQLFDDPTFHDAEGKFDPFRYQQVLINAQLTEEDFLDAQRSSVERQQLVDGLFGGVVVPNALGDVYAAFQGESRTVKYIKLDQRDAPAPSDPTPSELDNFFKTNQAQYRAPEYRNISYIAINQNDFNNADSISDEDARAYYERNENAYRTEERRAIKRITFNSVQQATDAARELKEGLSFSDLQARMNLTDGDISLGFLTKAEVLDKKLADIAFALELNKPSDAVDGDFGKMIVVVDRIEEENVQTFEDAKAEIKRELAVDQNNRDVIAKVDEIEDARAEGSTFEEIAQRLDVKLVKTGPISREAQQENATVLLAPIPEQAAVLDEAFATDVGIENNVIEIGREGFLWFEVTEIKPARDRTLDEVHTQAIRDWKAFELEKALDKRAEDIAASVRDGGDITKVAEEEGLIVVTVDDVKRGEPATGLSGAAVQTAFQGSKDFVAVSKGTSGNQFTILQVAQVTSGTNNLDSEENDQLKDFIQSDALTVYITRVRDREGSSINAQALEYATDFDRQRHGHGYGY